MMHYTRHYQIKTVDTPESLADWLTRAEWCGCQGFAYAGTYWLNDSTPDGIAEYAIFRDGRQIESHTVGWATPESLAQHAERYATAPIETFDYEWHEWATERPQLLPSFVHDGPCWCCR